MKAFQLEMIRMIQKLHSDGLTLFVEGITFIGEITVIIAIITYIYFIYNKKVGQKVIYISLLSMLVNNWLKLLIKAPRPIGEPGIISLRVETAGGYSFPSGHSQNSATLFTWLSQIVRKRWFTIMSIVLVVLIMLSRLYLGVHYPIDSLVGGILGLGIAWYLFWKIDRLKKPHLVGLVVAAIFLPFIIYFGVTDANMANEIFKLYGLFLGSVLAFMVEEKWIHFQKSPCRWRALLRYILGIGIALGLQAGLKYVLPASNIGDFIRYFGIAFIALGCYPYLFTKLKF